jgi:hypothetical protein
MTDGFVTRHRWNATERDGEGYALKSFAIVTGSLKFTILVARGVLEKINHKQGNFIDD